MQIQVYPSRHRIISSSYKHGCWPDQPHQENPLKNSVSCPHLSLNTNHYHQHCWVEQDELKLVPTYSRNSCDIFIVPGSKILIMLRSKRTIFMLSAKVIFRICFMRFSRDLIATGSLGSEEVILKLTKSSKAEFLNIFRFGHGSFVATHSSAYLNFLPSMTQHVRWFFPVDMLHIICRQTSL